MIVTRYLIRHGTLYVGECWYPDWFGQWDVDPMTARCVPGPAPAPSSLADGVSGEAWGATEQGGRARTGKPRIYPTYKSWAQPEISHGRMADLRRGAR